MAPAVGGGSVRAGGRWRRYLRACNTLRLTHWGVISPDRALRANIRFTFQAMVTKLHSPRTLSSPRSRNCRKPRTDLMMPNTSTASPCIWPPITINGERYIDGGVRSMLNADLAMGADIVIAVLL